MPRFLPLCLVPGLLLALPPAVAAQTPDFTEGTFQPTTLGAQIEQASHIVVLQVKKADRQKHLICYRKIADLKGKLSGDQVQHDIGESPEDPDWRALLDWARPGQVAVCFHEDKIVRICLGNSWYMTFA